MKLLSLFNREEVDVGIEPTDLVEPDFRPATELEVFASRTRQIVDGLDVQIADLDRQITEAIARLGDLKRIRDGQNLALRYMEGEI